MGPRRRRPLRRDAGRSREDVAAATVRAEHLGGWPWAGAVPHAKSAGERRGGTFASRRFRSRDPLATVCASSLAEERQQGTGRELARASARASACSSEDLASSPREALVAAGNSARARPHQPGHRRRGSRVRHPCLVAGCRGAGVAAGDRRDPGGDAGLAAGRRGGRETPEGARGRRSREARLSACGGGAVGWRRVGPPGLALRRHGATSAPPGE
mmetsp:Transcript_41391/g.119097  ORF Transcript_41391/g.119097 Transcript_41391/m.119097 type:complete len:215 (-) Transcript_41391:1120-1764(-)